MYKLKISPQAKTDLAEIKEYISNELFNPQAAVKLVSNITKRIHSLTEYPAIGVQLSSVIGIQTDYRFIVCNNYLVFYRSEDYNIYVSRILYSKRDYMRILFGDLPEIED